MKQIWQKVVVRIDALSLRERSIVFALAALAVITLFNEFVLDRLFASQKMLAQQVQQDQAKISEVRTQINEKVRLRTIDPDAENRETSRKLAERLRQRQLELQDIQKSLVAPEKMADVIESILKKNKSLRIVSLKTFAPANVAAASSSDNKAASTTGGSSAAEAKNKQDIVPAAPVYKHGVELVVEGSYLEMVRYMEALETLPWQLYWAKAKLDAQEPSKVTLTLTLYTLSLDKKWLNL